MMPRKWTVEDGCFVFALSLVHPLVISFLNPACSNNASTTYLWEEYPAIHCSILGVSDMHVWSSFALSLNCHSSMLPAGVTGSCFHHLGHCCARKDTFRLSTLLQCRMDIPPVMEPLDVMRNIKW
ncbi:hypothetical protein BD769DRAFT_74197 [Suillus cothurnatus]|nr:hypothetical protein BD769DRAFT_74197 [Suillus cothurnatus]